MIAVADYAKSEAKASSKTTVPLAVGEDCGDSRWLSTRTEDLGSFRVAHLEI